MGPLWLTVPVLSPGLYRYATGPGRPRESTACRTKPSLCARRRQARFTGSGPRRVLDGRCGFRLLVASWTGITGVLRSTQMATIRIALSRSCRADLLARSGNR
jgi:hypothetical protein